MSYTHDDVMEATRGLTAVTIPVHVEVNAAQVILSQPEMRELLLGADGIALGNCQCREAKGDCGYPVDVCLAIDATGTERLQEGGWREVSVGQALDVLERTYEAGLVHLAYRRGNGTIRYVCSCCSCCCGPLRALKRFDYHDAIAESAFRASFDAAQCIGCGTCVERCPFGAYERRDGQTGIEFAPEKCFGCGLCVGTCPSGAISLRRRDNGTNDGAARSDDLV